MDYGEQFGISLEGTCKNIFGNKGDFENFLGNMGTQIPGGPYRIPWLSFGFNIAAWYESLLLLIVSTLPSSHR